MILAYISIVLCVSIILLVHGWKKTLLRFLKEQEKRESLRKKYSDLLEKCSTEEKRFENILNESFEKEEKILELQNRIIEKENEIALLKNQNALLYKKIESLSPFYTKGELLDLSEKPIDKSMK